jgi:hypothetical protein
MVKGLIAAGKVRTWLYEMEEFYKEKVGTEHYLFHWILRYSAWTATRLHPKDSG